MFFKNKIYLTNKFGADTKWVARPEFHELPGWKLWDGNGGRVILNKHRMPTSETGNILYH